MWDSLFYLNHTEYSDYCRYKVRQFRNRNKVLTEYVYLNHEPIGMVIAFLKNNVIWMGVSKVAEEDRFDKHIGQWQAVKRSKPVGYQNGFVAPFGSKRAFVIASQKLYGRAIRYFKQAT